MLGETWIACRRQTLHLLAAIRPNRGLMSHTVHGVQLCH
jgi:hypothetical protein